MFALAEERANLKQRQTVLRDILRPKAVQFPDVCVDVQLLDYIIWIACLGGRDKHGPRIPRNLAGHLLLVYARRTAEVFELGKVFRPALLRNPATLPIIVTGTLTVIGLRDFFQIRD